MYIVIDFDGTCVTHEYPNIGREIGATEVLQALTSAGHRLILFTMRSDDPKNKQLFLTEAVNWFRERAIPLYGIQTNPTQKHWTTSPKAYGELYIDDAALGCPLVYPEDGSRPYIDWAEVKKIVKDLLEYDIETG
jgi:hypothetical protein